MTATTQRTKSTLTDSPTWHLSRQLRENAEENALAVQFNNAGQVRLQLRSQFTKGLSPSAEGSFAGVLQAQAGSSRLK